MSVSEISLDIDPKDVTEKIVSFIRDKVEEASASGVVIGLSGGVDSSTVAFLSVKALGPEKVLGLIMPTDVTRKEDIEDAVNAAELLKIKYEIINLSPVLKSFKEVLKKCEHFSEENIVAFGNIHARVRMILLYYHANILNRIVAGTGNKSELLIGYFTKYGDGGVDILPIGDLYKTQVRQLARYLGVPEKIVLKTPSAGLWEGQTDEGEIGITYDTLDKILHGLVDLKMDPKVLSETLKIPVETVERVKEMILKSEHKRNVPPIAKIVYKK
ncbi:MAG: NAD+ synthase [Candidatus Baldrarchaeia archaeon]